MLNMCTKFHENTLTVIEGTRFLYNCQLQITKGHNIMRNVGEDMVFVLCTPSDDGLYLNQNL